MTQDFKKLINGNVNVHFNMWAALHSLNSITGLLGELYQPAVTFWGLWVREVKVIDILYLGNIFAR